MRASFPDQVAPTKEDWEEDTGAGAPQADEADAGLVEEDDSAFPGGPTRISAPPTESSARPRAAVAPRAQDKGVQSPEANRAKARSLSGAASDDKLAKLKSLSLNGPLPEHARSASSPRSSVPFGTMAGVLVAALAGGGLYLSWPKISAVLRNSANPATEKPAMRFLVAELSSRPAATLTASGYISAETFTIGATVSGRIDSVLVTEGAFVKKKQLLIQLDDSQIKADMRLAQQKAASHRRIYSHLKSLERAGAALPLEVSRARGDMDAAEAEVSTYTPKLQQMRIVAPVEATVVEVLAHAGETLTAGSTTGIIRLADLNRPMVEADINEADVPSIHIGDRVEASVESFPDVIFAGTLKSISAQADRTKGTFKATIALIPDRRLRTNMSAKIRFQGAANLTPKLLLPREAVKDGAVWAVVDGRARRRPVTTLPGGSAMVEVSAGLKPGERIIVSGYDSVAEGDKVQVPGN